MYLKKLELVGFKSFFDKTNLHFEPGVTAIVGPNGTGKSNVFDAIRWALGEQSVKSLRGSEMQDVIFNGSDLKEPLGMAEVNLTFDNRGKFFSLDHDEVAITRRIFRSGESEYLLNKAPVRLKDILDLLMGTGIGAESYSLVAQGKIDLILSSRPEDRRLVFDEASGITKYKAQKKESTRKLEQTEENLTRINDIIIEVKRQIGSLERQANKARKYKEAFEELKTKEIMLARVEKAAIFYQRGQIIKGLSELENQEAKLQAQIKQQESQVAGRQEDLKNFQDNIASIKNEITNLDNALVRNQQRITLNQERAKELEENQKYLTLQIEQTKNRLIQDEAKLNGLEQEHFAVRKSMEEKNALLKVKEEELENLNSSTKTSLENISGAKKEILDLASQIAHLKNEIIDAGSGRQIYLARQKRLEIEKLKAKEEGAAAESNLKVITDELTLLESNFASLALKLAGIKNELGEQNLTLDKINRQIEELEKQKFGLQAHKKFLEELKTKYQGLGESMNAFIYLDKLPVEKTSGLIIKIKERLIFDDKDRAISEAVNFKLSGEAKPLDLDTDELAKEIARIEEELNSLKNNKTQIESRRQDINQAIQKEEENLRNQEMVLVNKKANHQSARGHFNQIKQEEEIIIIELTETEREVSGLSDKITAQENSLSDLENTQKAKEQLIAQQEDTISANSRLKEGTLVTITKTKTELEALNKRIGLDEATLKILQDTYVQDQESLSNFQKQLAENTLKHSTLSRENDALKEEIKAGRNNLEGLKLSSKCEQDRYSKISQEAEEAFKNIELDKNELSNIKQKLYELQMQNKETDYKYQNIRARLLEVYKIDLEGPLCPQQEPQDINPDLLKDEIEKLKQKVDACGTVNLVAIEEYDELKKRYDFLTQQQNDLLQAKESLHQAILKINRTTRTMFLEIFAQIAQEFRNYFKLLFNGGDAQVFLVDEHDPLESGIEIICRPPGKKLQNVLLLSGGEKSLSAIALIFAIFKVKPAPFCVLDEIDAALDEANIDRFGRLLQEFTKASQFIVITHNKKTITNANVMYGITMEQSGVSKIVSVKFSENSKIAVVQEKEPDAEALAEPV